jgi:hypothetical protein
MNRLEEWTCGVTTETIKFKITLEYKGVSASKTDKTIMVAREKASDKLLIKLKERQKRGYQISQSTVIIDDCLYYYDRYTFLDGTWIDIGHICEETYPCEHSVKTSERLTPVGSSGMDIHSFFKTKEAEIPKHFSIYGDDMDCLF